MKRNTWARRLLSLLLLAVVLSLVSCFGAETERAGVTVTKEVPHSKETIPEIRDRERTNPPPARGDTAIHSHKIPRAGNDNCERTE